jgi:membrane associated rhomboid family serine protease
MLSDRPYLRDDYPRQRTSVLAWLICGILAGFVLQLAVDSSTGGNTPLLRDFAVTVPGLMAGRVWTLLTHSFLHSPTNLFHLIGNLLALFFLGRELLPLLGTRRFLGIYAAALTAGALAWTAVHWRSGGVLLGATAGVDALAIVYACFFPAHELNFLVFFVLPVTLKPKHFALGLLAFDLFGLLVWEIPRAALPWGITIASSAHLGGMAVGWLYYRYLHDAYRRHPEVELPRWLRRSAKARAATPSPAQRVNLTKPQDLRAEVDRILDKINSDGFGALTADEKRLLDEAKDLLSRR